MEYALAKLNYKYSPEYFLMYKDYLQSYFDEDGIKVLFSHNSIRGENATYYLICSGENLYQNLAVISNEMNNNFYLNDNYHELGCSKNYIDFEKTLNKLGIDFHEYVKEYPESIKKR